MILYDMFLVLNCGQYFIELLQVFHISQLKNAKLHDKCLFEILETEKF